MVKEISKSIDKKAFRAEFDKQFPLFKQTGLDFGEEEGIPDVMLREYNKRGNLKRFHTPGIIEIDPATIKPLAKLSPEDEDYKRIMLKIEEERKKNKPDNINGVSNDTIGQADQIVSAV